MQLLGNPQEGRRTLHIAGTKGKGSTCAFIANILGAAGFKVGLYTSPHLVDVRERIRILQKTKKEEISKKDFVRLIEKIKPCAERLRKTKLGELTYYEILTALAFLYFREEKIDFAVLETGIGGRLDATNLARSFVCAISPISYEHTQVLGSTLKKIAAEKAAIIKDQRQIVITGPQRPAALEVIRRRTKKVGAKLYEIGKDIQVREESSSLQGQFFSVKGLFNKYSRLKIGLLGKHQIVNAAVAVGCVEVLRFHEVSVSQQAIREGLKKTRWPGRLEIISRRPQVVLDAAHNRASACALKDALKETFKFRRLILVFGVSQDKDVKGILRELTPLASRIILTKTKNPRALAPEAIKRLIKRNGKPIFLTGNPGQALKVARETSAKKDLILVSGSLFLLGEILKNEGQGKLK